jgi:3-keto-5-aminohexanoate cleavage enzyme
MNERTIFDVQGAKPLIINFAPTGMVPTKAMNNAVPITPEEIIRDVLRCAERGITIAHIHARDEQGKPTHKKEVYGRIIAGIREMRTDIVICASCSGRGGLSLQERLDVLDLPDDLRPDMASLTLSSMNFADTHSATPPSVIDRMAERMKVQGVMPELEIFDIGMANMVRRLLQRGLLSAPVYCNILLGNVASAQPRLLDIVAILAALPDARMCALAGLGRSQLPMAAIAVASADGVRIGLEDNLWLDAGRTQLASNVQLIGRVHSLAETLGRPVMTSQEFRTIFELND